MAKKEKYNFSEKYVREHRTFPVGNTVLLVICVLIQLALAAWMIFWQPSPKDCIEEYAVTIEPLEDGTLDITYSFIWKALDGSEPLTWVSIGMANPHYTVYKDSLSDIIEKQKHIAYDDYTALELHFKNQYYSGQVAVFSFKINQQSMLCQDENGCFYEFVPCWFNEIPVEHYTFRWKQSEMSTSSRLPENGYYTWSGSLACGEYQPMVVHYAADAFPDAETVDHTPFDDSGAYNNLQEDKIILMIIASVFIVLILLGELFIIDSYVSYGRGRGFLSDYGHPIHVYGRSNPRFTNAYHAHHVSHHSGGFSGGGGCACACACACAGGGRAGCSQKDTFGSSQVTDDVRPFSDTTV